jgi:MFS transporter, DHA2 family, methylenomycin A resistance protein
VLNDTARSSPALTLTVACLGFFVITLDVTVVNVSLPSIAADLHGAVSGLQWVVDAYTLMFAALLLSAGSLSDRVGASRAYAVGIAGFTVASAACGFAPDLGVLIGARAVQGVAAALMLPASLALVRQAFSDPGSRARGIALWTAGGGAAIAAGPVAGGALTDLLSWRSIFFINVPVGALVLLGLLRAARSPRRPVPFDLPGQVTAVIWLAALTFAVIEGGAQGFGSPLTVTVLVVFAAAFASFLVVERRVAHPMVPLGLFRSATVSVCTATGFTLNFAFYGLVFVLSLFLQQVLAASPLVAGLMFLPMTGLVTAVNMLAGRLTARHGPRLPMIIGQVIMIAGLLGLVTTHQDMPKLALALLMIPIGIGGGMAVPPITAALLEAVDANRAGLASGILNAGRQVGGALGVALFGALVAAPSIGFVPGLHISLVTGAAVLAATTVATALMPRPATEPAGDLVPALPRG